MSMKKRFIDEEKVVFSMKSFKIIWTEVKLLLGSVIKIDQIFYPISSNELKV